MQLACTTSNNRPTSSRGDADFYGLVADHLAQLDWRTTTRVWRRPEHDLSDRIPENIRTTLEQARSTFQVGAYDACAVMWRRAIEELAQRFNTGGGSLYDKLEELNNAYVIDEQMLERGHELRLEGNRGAHASDERVAREDARDMLELLRQSAVSSSFSRSGSATSSSARRVARHQSRRRRAKSSTESPSALRRRSACSRGPFQSRGQDSRRT